MQNGFTLLEIMIALSLVAILTIMALPNYRYQIAKTEQISAKLALYDLAEAMEIYYAVHHSYEGATLAELHINPIVGAYKLTIMRKETQSYLIAATPSHNEPDLQELTLDEKANFKDSKHSNDF